MNAATLRLTSITATIGAVLLGGCVRAVPTSPEEPPVAAGDTIPGPVPGYQFGAKFEPPVGRVVHGMGQWPNGNPQYLAMLPEGRKPGAELLFIDLGDTPRPWDPPAIAARMAEVRGAGRIPVMDLALRGLQPGPAALQELADKTYGIDSAVAYTTQYDARIHSFIDVLSAYGDPVMLRIGGEFSGPWNGYHPYAYPVAFRKIVQMFRARGVDNVAFVWCYEPAAADDFDHVDANGNAKWYPGDDVVDWFSIDVFSAGDVGGPVVGHGGATSFSRTIRFLDMAVAHHRPVIIAESSPSHFDLASPAEAASAWAEWFTPYFALIASRPEIKWFHYINFDWTTAGYYASSGWKNNDLTASALVSAEYLGVLEHPRFLHANELSLLNGWGPP
ncbi:MAG TPA: hypothetical protein VLE53_11165 [Gemmatimonadaceae bacterium]|nr:hypothetical protein [Gemmatimonadaceae bacterium]